jgi:hypothetical protein
MGVGSGIGGQFGFKSESVYGTPVTVATFLPVTKFSVKKGKTIVQGSGLAAGRLVELSAQRVVSTHDAKGSFELELVSNGLGQLLQTLMGTTVVPVQQAATTAYLQTHTLADPKGKSLTLQAGIPNTAGTVLPYTFQGCKIDDATFSFDIKSNNPVMSTWTVDAQDVSEVPALAAASFPATLRPFVGTDVTIKVGTFGAEVSVNGVTKVDVKIPRPQNTSLFYFGAAGLKAEPITNAFAQITGTVTANLVDKTVFVDKFASDTGFSLVIQAQGALIASTYYQTFRITLPGCYLEGDTPDLAGPDVVNGSFPFSYLYDGTNLPKIEYISTDVTL